MEDGFTGRDSKGLFTFYREQGEQEAKIGHMKSQLVKRGELNKHYASAIAVNAGYGNKRERVSLLMNHESINNKPSRYKQDDCLDKHQIYSSRHVFSLNFNSPRKNGYYLQLIASKNRRTKSEMEESTNRHIAIKINRKYLVGELSVRQMPSGQVKELFQLRKQGNVKALSSRKKESIEEETSHRTPRQNLEDKKFHIPMERYRKCKQKCEFKNTMLRDALQLRRQRLQSNVFWQQLKERKVKQQGKVFNINSKLEEWIALNDMGKIKQHHLPSLSPQRLE